MQPTDFEAILKVLADHKVDLVVVGGIAAALQGAPITTFDLDIVHSREEANLDRLMAALRELDAWYREKPDLQIAPDRERLGGPGHHLLMTSAGPLDVLGAVVTGGAPQPRDGPSSAPASAADVEREVLMSCLGNSNT